MFQFEKKKFFFVFLNDIFLAQIIAAKRRRRPSAKARLLGPRRSVAAAAAAAHRANVRAAAKPAVKTTPVTASADRIVVSNLPQDVSEVQIKVMSLILSRPLIAHAHPSSLL
jgi:hypothetical protein